jgi:hypothetical protein
MMNIEIGDEVRDRAYGVRGVVRERREVARGRESRVQWRVETAEGRSVWIGERLLEKVETTKDTKDTKSALDETKAGSVEGEA